MRECPWSCSGLFWFYPWRLRAVGSSQRASRCGFQFPRLPSIDGESESESRSVLSDSLWPHRLYSPWNSRVQNTGVGSLSLLQAIFPTQGLNPGLPHCRPILYLYFIGIKPGLPHCRQILYQLSHKGSPRILEWVAYPFSRGSSWPRNQTRVSCIAGEFFTNWAIRAALDKGVSKKTALSFWHWQAILFSNFLLKWKSSSLGCC